MADNEVVEIVWTPQVKRSAWTEFKEAAAAMLYHYQRCLFGAQYGL